MEGNMIERIKIVAFVLALVVSLIFAFVSYSRAQSTPTRTWIPNPGICEPPARDCFDDIIIEPPK
jgi:hypothetical protein